MQIWIKRNVSFVAFCDLSKVFDSVSHPTFIRKCLKLNIDSFWLLSYLSHKTQSVRIDNAMCWKGESLFLLFIKEMDKSGILLLNDVMGLGDLTDKLT